MQTQCPHCQTIFRITAAHLNIAQGQVRCGQCQNIFDATKHLGAQTHKKVNFSPEYPELLQEEYEEESRWAALLWWTLVALVLVGLLAGQTVWWLQRDFILQHAQLRPWLERFCYTFLCNLPPTRDIESFKIIEPPVVQAHPAIKEAIKVDAIFTNTATFPQPYPLVQLTFQDLNGQILAQRRFQPTEYLSPDYAHKLLKEGMPVHLQLELKDTLGIIQEGRVAESSSYRLDFF